MVSVTFIVVDINEFPCLSVTVVLTYLRWYLRKSFGVKLVIYTDDRLQSQIEINLQQRSLFSFIRAQHVLSTMGRPDPKSRREFK